MKVDTDAVTEFTPPQEAMNRIALMLQLIAAQTPEKMVDVYQAVAAVFNAED